jgi:FKBP-type peptidyl-prolyl cis-trans isomerase
MGMKIAAKRRRSRPNSLYGAEGRLPVIPANSTLADISLVGLPKVDAGAAGRHRRGRRARRPDRSALHRFVVEGRTVGEKPDSSLDRGEPFRHAGAGMVIPGWDAGRGLEGH